MPATGLHNARQPGILFGLFPMAPHRIRRPEGVGVTAFTLEVIMDTCAKPGDFKKYFDENMQALGLGVPVDLFDTFDKAIETAAKMTAALYALGPGATVAEIVGATYAVEKLLVVASLQASYYTGALAGSIVVAFGRVRACGASLSDVFVFLQQHDLLFKDWDTFFVHNPQVLDTNHPCRKSFAMAAGAWQAGRERTWA